MAIYIVNKRASSVITVARPTSSVYISFRAVRAVSAARRYKTNLKGGNDRPHLRSSHSTECLYYIAGPGVLHVQEFPRFS